MSFGGSNSKSKWVPRSVSSGSLLRFVGVEEKEWPLFAVWRGNGGARHVLVRFGRVGSIVFALPCVAVVKLAEAAAPGRFKKPRARKEDNGPDAPLQLGMRAPQRRRVVYMSRRRRQLHFSPESRACIAQWLQLRLRRGWCYQAGWMWKWDEAPATNKRVGGGLFNPNP